MNVVFGTLMNQIMSKVSNFMVLTTSEAAPIDRADGVIIGRLSELTDEDCEEFIENDGDSYGAWYRNYDSELDNKPPYSLESAKESFISRIKYAGIDVSDDDFIVKLYD